MFACTYFIEPLKHFMPMHFLEYVYKVVRKDRGQCAIIGEVETHALQSILSHIKSAKIK